MRVFQGLIEERKWGVFKTKRRPFRVVDIEGVIRVQRSDGVVRQTTGAQGPEALQRLWNDITIYNGDSIITPDMFVIAGSHVVDLSGVNTLDQAQGIAQGEFAGLPPDMPVALVGVQGQRGL
jgi:hypothetical protein